MMTNLVREYPQMVIMKCFFRNLLGLVKLNSTIAWYFEQYAAGGKAQITHLCMAEVCFT